MYGFSKISDHVFVEGNLAISAKRLPEIEDFWPNRLLGPRLPQPIRVNGPPPLETNPGDAGLSGPSSSEQSRAAQEVSSPAAKPTSSAAWQATQIGYSAADSGGMGTRRVTAPRAESKETPDCAQVGNRKPEIGAAVHPCYCVGLDLIYSPAATYYNTSVCSGFDARHNIDICCHRVGHCHSIDNCQSVGTCLCQ